MGWHTLAGATPHEIQHLIINHHYSGRMPGNIQHVYAARAPGGLFGDTGEPRAAAIFSIPPTRWREDVLELTRLVRAPEYDEPISQLIAFSLRALKRKKYDLVVSFADWTQGHHGGVYQATNWQYGGQRERTMDGLVVNGTFLPGRSCNSRYGTRSVKRLKQIRPDLSVAAHYDEGKHIYWYALTRAGRRKAKRLDLQSLPYPKPDINADRPLDEPVPTGANEVQPLGSAPNLSPGGLICE